VADSKATVRIDAKTDGFKRGMKEAEKAAIAAGSKSGSAFSRGMNVGAAGALKSIKGVFAQAKTLATSLGGVLGGVGFASLAKGAIDSQKSFKQLAFRINLAGGQAIKWQTLQKQVQKQALASKVDIGKLGDGFKAALQETGDLKAAQGSLEAIATIGKKTGTEFATLGKLSGILQQKFGLASGEMGDGLLQMVTAATQGGGSIEDLAADFAEVGGKAKTLGLQGPEGIRKMVGFLNLAKKETGSFSQAMTALPQVFDQIIERTSKGVVASGGKVPIKIQAVDKNGKPRDPFAIIQDILAKTKGDAAKLGEFGFGGEGLQTLLGLAKPFAKELQDTGKLTKSSGDKFQASIMEAAGAANAYADMQKATLAATAADNIQDAINRLQIAFTKPEMIAALEKMAAVLPRFATAVANVLAKIMDNPALAAGVFVGAKALAGGASAGGGAAAALMRAAMAGGGGAAATSITTAGAGASGAMKTAITTGGTAASSSMGTALAKGAKGLAGSLVGGLALPAMIAGLTLAFDQASKLGDDIDERSDERRNFERIKAKQEGKDTFTSERSLEERAKSFLTKTKGDRFKDLTEEGATETRSTKTGKKILGPTLKVKFDEGDGPDLTEAIPGLAEQASNRITGRASDEQIQSAARQDERRNKFETFKLARKKLGRDLTDEEGSKLSFLSGRQAGGDMATPESSVAALMGEAKASNTKVAAAIAKVAPAIVAGGMRITNFHEMENKPGGGKPGWWP